MRTDTAQKIEEYIVKNKQATAKELSSAVGITPQALFRQLARLQAKNRIYKIGKPPKVFYLIREFEESIRNLTDLNIDKDVRKIIDSNYLIITPSGERKVGLEGFRYWCNKTGQIAEKTANEYVKIWRKYNVHKVNGLIDGTKKLLSTFPHIFVDKLYYLDFYSIERFGKTKLGQLLLYAKQSQNIRIIKELIADIKPQIEHWVKKWHVGAVGFVPPTVKREVQFVKELEQNLGLKIQKIPIYKVKTEVAVPQKTLNKLEDRIENAQKTIIVEASGCHKNILLIDDAVGSGATINETAKKIRDKGICKGKIIGLAITGSFKGFDVISEV